ncbi:polymorphic toxin-type HINT domain-containing protein [Streptomyces sp. NPDC091371]|uniref:polymorphic toxin-type HINT domain-containing protein n=1 Tax=Streptomyces sp. NPDC091371 TaxID=3155303 RepID=UPI00342B1BE3
MLVASLLPLEAWAAPPGDRTGVTLPGLSKDLKAELDHVATTQLEGWNGEPPASLDAYAPTMVAPPAGASASVPLTPTAGVEFTQVGSLPVSIGKVQDTGAPPSGTWSATVQDRAKTEAAGIDGAVIAITPPADAVNPVDVALDYTKFEDLYGTEWASRLKLRQFPACFLDTPDLPECAVSKDVPSTNVPDEKRAIATIDPAAPPVEGMHTMSGGSGPSVLVASDGASGPGGSYKATSLSASGTWTAGGSGGGFSWTYPLTVPPAPAGPTPSIAFSYSSQSVDGRTSVTNGQASWVGDGWDYHPGFIERRYRACSDDLKATPSKPNNDNATDKKKSDLCWSGDSVVLSLGGSTTELVRDAASGKWVPASDDGSRVELKTGSGNGAKDGEYWVVTTRDGMRYHYGRHSVGTHGDGTSPQTVTDSVFTVPVFGNHPGEPCYQTAYANSSCTQAWRWNLDYVEDLHGNAMVIDWKKEENRYAKNEKFAEKDRAKVGYIRGGYPVRILYGLRADNLAGAPAGRVEFKTEQRCFPDKDTNCDDSQFGSKNALGWWDTPSALHCKMDAANCYITSPTFWSRMRLDTVTTYGQRTEGSTALTKVDQWALKQSLPRQRTDTSPPLWLESITRTGYGPGDSTNGVQLPPVSFKANVVDMPNRVARAPKDGKPDATPDFDRLRVQTILTETGGDIHVTYSAPCAIGTTVPDPAKNTTRCFPVRWSPDPELAPEKTPIEVFNKYVVESVTEKDRVAQRPNVTTTYTYEGGAAWAKEDDELSKPEMRTHSQWRGYASVLTTTGKTENAGKPTATEQSQTRTRYFRGLSTAAAKVTVKDSTDTEDLGEDLPQYQGQTAETITYTKAGGSLENRHLTWPSSQKTAQRPRIDDASRLVEAYRGGVERTDEIQTVSGGKARMVRTRNVLEGTYGLLKTAQTDVMENKGTGWTTVKQACSKPSYVHNTASNLIGLTAEIRETTGDCTDAGIAAGTLLSAARTSFDAVNAFGSAPTKGLPYQVDTLDAAGTGWTTSGRSEYDALGRTVKTYDTLGNPSTTAYSPATGPAFTVTATNALGHTVSTKVEPARGSVLEATDANGRKVTTAYDELGRTTKVWTPSQNPATSKPAYTFEYQIAELKTPAVTTRALKDNGTYSTSIAIYDGLLRPRQTQTEGHGGVRVITDTLYSENGTVTQTNNGYLAEGNLSTTIFVPVSVTQIHNSTQTAYDGLGRAVRSTTVEKGTAKHSAITQYGGDWTLARSAMSPTGATPLPGSRAVKTTTDALNRTTAVEHYTSTAAADVNPALDPNPAANKTSYSYDDVRGTLAKVTDPAGNSWTYAYDARGRMTSSTDPDMGTSTFAYNNLDQQVSATNVNGLAQYTKYDALGRKTELRDDNPDTGNLVASWTYDTLPGAKGQPVSATRNWGAGSYTSEVTGYDSEYRPTGSKITIPDLPTTKGLAGTYAYSTTYTPTGKVQSTTLPATVGGLAAEKLITRYNADGMVQTVSGLSWYTADTIYGPFGEVLRTASGNAPHRVWTTNSYDSHTGRVTKAESHRETRDPLSQSNLLSSLAYTYDAVGNPTSITDTQPGTTAQTSPVVDRQCFTYDQLGQLTRAWTGKTAGCPTSPTGPALSEVGSGIAGDAYWQDYEFDAIGNRTKLTDHDPTNSALDDETSYAYGVDIGGPQPSLKKQPHALTKVNKTTRTPGSTLDSLSTYAYDQAGNTKSRTIDGDTQTLTWDRRNTLQSATSPGIGSVAVTGLAGKCLDVQDGQTTDGTPVQLLACNETKPQQWRITGDTVQALGKCLTAEGGKARLKTCDPANAGQKFTYRSTDKALVTGTNQCLTVPNDNTADGTDLDLSTCTSPAVTSAQQWSFGNLTTYLYDASGNRVIQETGSARTLYLGETEITVNTAGQAIDAVRYYGSPGGATTVRHTNGKATGHTLAQQLTDHHNTATINVEQKDGQEVTRRKSDPYGNPRGAQPSNWPGNHTFLGVGTDDNTTGLTHIGAREYEPQTGRFISVDPIIDISDPLQMNGYTYSAGNPITGADPSGLKTEECGTLYNCHGNTVITASNASQITYNTVDRQVRYYQTHAPARDYRGGGRGLDESWTHTRVMKQIFINQNVKYVTGFDFKPGHFLAGMGQGLADLADLVASGTPAAQLGLPMPSAGDAYRGAMTSIGIDTTRNDYQLGELLSPAPGGALFKGLAKGAEKAFSICKNSFTPGTPVLMADGSSKPIEELTAGDEVLATDPETAETSVKEVTATITGQGSKNLVEVTIDTDGNADTATASATATDGHPFWVPELGEWVDATDLLPGTWLRTDSGAYVQITAVKRWTQQAKVHNLTVADLHTYYVLAGQTPVLVHNCRGSNPTHATKCRCATGGAPKLAVQEGEVGTYGALAGRARTGDGLTPNHIPQAALLATPRQGISVVMQHADHLLTRTYGPAGMLTKRLDQGLPMRNVIAKDLWDLRSIGQQNYGDPSHFNQQIRGILAAHRAAGNI